MSAVNGARVFLRQDGATRRLCTVVVGRDGSLYISPNRGRGQHYLCGQSFFSPRQRDLSFTTGAQNQGTGTPKLSLHASGRVHITVAGRIAAGPLWIPPLGALEGAHVATILPDSMEALPLFSGSIAGRVNASEHAWIVEAPPGVENCRVAFHIGSRPAFGEDRWMRPVSAFLWARPIFLAIGVLENAVLNSSNPRGVTMLAGMDPSAGGDYQHFLWLTSAPPGWSPSKEALRAATLDT